MLDPKILTERLLFMDRCLTSCLKGGRKETMSYATMLLTSSHFSLLYSELSLISILYCSSLFLFFSAPHGVWDLSSPTTDQTHAPSLEAYTLNHWTAREVPVAIVLNKVFLTIFDEQNYLLIISLFHHLSCLVPIFLCYCKWNFSFILGFFIAFCIAVHSVFVFWSCTTLLNSFTLIVPYDFIYTGSYHWKIEF